MKKTTYRQTGHPNNRRLGIIGGTFDPIHIGHLVAAEWAKEAFHLQEVIFMPAGDPPHKDGRLVSPASHRLNMTRLAVDNNDNFRVSTVEIEREGKSYTVDTLEALIAEYGDDVELYFIMGADSLADLPTWYRPAYLLDLCRVIAVTRPEWDVDQIIARLGGFYDEHRERICLLEIPGLNVKSRELRKRVQQHISVRYMTPDPVVDYIARHGLYRVEDDSDATRAGSKDGAADGDEDGLDDGRHNDGHDGTDAQGNNRKPTDTPGAMDCGAVGRAVPTL